MQTISEILKDLKTCGLSESIIKDIETIETIHLRLAYLNSSVSVPFEQWHEATFKK